MEIIEVNCQTVGCKNKVTVIKYTPYFGVFCKECLNRHSKIYSKENKL